MASISLAGGLDPDDPIGTGSELARFLGGSEDSFKGLLLQLIAKADPGNFDRLLRVFPHEVLTWQLWASLEDIPTAAELAQLRALAWPMGGPVPTRYEIQEQAREYNRGRGEASST